jgi:hypothetical protein
LNAIGSHLGECKDKKQAQPRNKREERAGRVAQVVEHLPSKSEALSPNSSTGKKIKRGERFISCSRSGDHGSYFRRVPSLNKGNGDFIRVHIHTTRHVRGGHFPGHSQLKTLPSMLSLRSLFKKGRWQTHFGACSFFAETSY